MFVRWFGALKRHLPFIIFILLLAVALAMHFDWTSKRKNSRRAVGVIFSIVELAVPSFGQSDGKWRGDPLGEIAASGSSAWFGAVLTAPTALLLHVPPNPFPVPAQPSGSQRPPTEVGVGIAEE